jgi:hypothetical protein
LQLGHSLGIGHWSSVILLHGGHLANAPRSVRPFLRFIDRRRLKK